MNTINLFHEKMMTIIHVVLGMLFGTIGIVLMIGGFLLLFSKPIVAVVFFLVGLMLYKLGRWLMVGPEDDGREVLK